MQGDREEMIRRQALPEGGRPGTKETGAFLLLLRTIALGSVAVELAPLKVLLRSLEP